jgi:hypothetical protein
MTITITCEGMVLILNLLSQNSMLANFLFLLVNYSDFWISKAF